jgi:hypothetical protein
MNAQTERYKAEAVRSKEQRGDARQDYTAKCDCIYKFALLVAATLLVLLSLPRLTNLTFFGVVLALSPAEPPPLPKNAVALDATDADVPQVYLSHEVVRPLRRKRARFVVHLVGDEDAWAAISEVAYYLHPAYGKTVHVLRTPPFTLDIPAIGEFLLYADVKLARGRLVRLQRYLDA